MLNPPIYKTCHGIERALLKQARNAWQLSVHIPGDKWVTHEGNGRYAVRMNNGTTDNVVYRGTAVAVAQRFGEQ